VSKFLDKLEWAVVRLSVQAILLLVPLSATICHAQCYEGPLGWEVYTTISPQDWAPGQSYNVMLTNPAGYFADGPGYFYVFTAASYDAGDLYTEDPNVTVSALTYVSPTEITLNVTVAAGASTEDDGVSLVGCGNTIYSPPGTVEITPSAPPPPTISLSRTNLMQVQASGAPTPGTFSFSTQAQSGTTNAGAGFAQDYSSSTNPTVLALTDPDNPDLHGRPSPGGLEQINVTYSASSSWANDNFDVPTFGMSCYDTTRESDWGTPPSRCGSESVKKVRYSGTVKNPPDLTGTFCSAFIEEVKIQGSGVLNSGQDIQYINGEIVDVPYITTRDGTRPIIGGSVARALSIIPQPGVLLDLDQIGNNIVANDIGGDVSGYRLDLYEGIGKAVCADYDNIMTVGACSPKTDACPALAVQ